MNSNIVKSLKMSAIALAVGQAFAPVAVAQQSPEVVVVTGIRASARSSVAIKRDTMEVVDSITAEDIGKLPDPNVGETLTRIPGVQAYRYGGEAASPFGGGSSGVTIRGLGYTAMQTNGRAYFSAGNREFNVEAALPGMVAGIDVYKNPSAEHIEGGIGGLINVRTRNPSDFKNLTVSAGVTTKRNDLAKKVDPEMFALIANRFDLGGGSRIGVMANATYQKSTVRNDNNTANTGPALKRAIRGDTAEYADLAAKNTANLPGQPMLAYVGRSDINFLSNMPTTPAQTPNTAGLNADQISNIMLGTWVNNNVAVETIMKERKGLNLAADYRVSNTLRFYTEANYFYYMYHQHYRRLVSNDGANVQNLKTAPFAYTESLANRNSNGGSDDVILNQRLLGGTYLNSGVNSWGLDNQNPWKTMIGAAGVEWSPTSRLALKADANYIKSTKKGESRRVELDSAVGKLWSTTRVADGAPHTLDFAGPSLADPSSYVFRWYQNDNDRNDDHGYAVALSGTYDLDGVFSKLRFGARTAEQHDRFRHFSFGRPLTTDGKPITANQSNAIAAATLAGNMQNAPSNFMYGDAGYAGGFVAYAPDALMGNQVMTAFPNSAIPAVGSFAENPGNRRAFDEKINAAYLVGDFSAFDDRLKGNVGVRLVRTETTAMARAIDRTGQFVDVVQTSAYNNVLPTFNATYNVAPDTLVRAGFGRGMTRPSLGDINPALNYNVSAGTGNIANTGLKPLVADSYDISLEHYFNKTNYAALALFDKEIKNFPLKVIECQTATLVPAYSGTADNGCTNGQYSMTKAVNAEKGYARGLEVSGQMFFDANHGILNNFGVSGSYSYVKTSNPINFGTPAKPNVVDTPQPMQSKHNFSVSGMYENKGLSARLVYTWRSEAVLFNVDPYPIWQRYIKAYGLLDGSISYEVAENTTLQFSAVNILDKAAQRGIGQPGVAMPSVEFQHFTNGRIISLGLRYKFGNK